MGQGQPDTTGAGMYRRPRWVCVAEGHTAWSSRQPTIQQAQQEAAELFGVNVAQVTVEAWDNMLPNQESEAWIDPLK